MSRPQSVEMVLLLPGSLSAACAFTHVGFYWCYWKENRMISQTPWLKIILPKIYILYYFIVISVFTSVIQRSKTVWQTNNEDEPSLMQPCCARIPFWMNWHFVKCAEWWPSLKIMPLHSFEPGSNTIYCINFCLLLHAFLAFHISFNHVCVTILGFCWKKIMKYKD